MVLARHACYMGFNDTTETRQRRGKAAEPIWAAIAEEQGVTVGEAHFLPGETVLGPKAEAAFQQAFCARPASSK
ncbi:MAG: hypothetical protein PHD72_04275 [Patescibacteria group bacterium]|nr:hypothetical protein [Patescibacteria group bacterium]